MQVMPNVQGAEAPDPRKRPADPMQAAQVERDAARLISKARADLVMSQPFFGALALRLRVVPDWSCPTFAVDGVSMIYNPGYAHALPFRQLVGVVAHEVMHCALAHHVRQGDRDGEQWNEAADFAINGIIKGTFELPDDVLYDPAFIGMAAEEIYRIRHRKPKNNGGGGKAPPQGGGGKAPPQGGNGPSGGAPGQDKPPLSTGTVQPPPGAAQSEAVRTEQEADWSAATAQAAQAAKRAGKLPAGLEELVGKSREAKVDWREQLRDFFAIRAKDDFSWSRPNRRFIAQGLYLPSAYSEKIGRIGWVIDTSASVSSAELATFWGEFEAVISDVQPEALRVIQCDAKVQADETVDSAEYTPPAGGFRAKGRGGSDMTPAFDLLAEDDEGVECIICVTDLELFRWPDDPGVPVLWVSTGSEHAKVPPFGTVIQLDIAGGAS